MNKEYLNKVIDQLVSETRIDYDKERVNVPFFPSSFLSFPLLSNFPHSILPSLFSSLRFFEHCESVYGLNEEETRYVWNEYVQTIKDIIDYGL